MSGYTKFDSEIYSEELHSQGESILTTKNLKEIALIPAGLQAFRFYPHFGGLFLLQQIQRDMPQGGYIFRGAIFPDPALIFSKADVQYPVQCVLDCPMAPYGFAQALGIRCQTTDVVSSLFACHSTHCPFAFDHRYGAQPRPFAFLAQPGDVTGRIITPYFYPTVLSIEALISRIGGLLELIS